MTRGFHAHQPRMLLIFACSALSTVLKRARHPRAHALQSLPLSVSCHPAMATRAVRFATPHDVKSGRCPGGAAREKRAKVTPSLANRRSPNSTALARGPVGDRVGAWRNASRYRSQARLQCVQVSRDVGAAARAHHAGNPRPVRRSRVSSSAGVSAERCAGGEHDAKSQARRARRAGEIALDRHEAACSGRNGHHDEQREQRHSRNGAYPEYPEV